MDNFFKMDIFFIVTTVAVVVISSLLVVALIRVLHILKRAEELSDRVSEEGEEILDDIRAARLGVKAGGLQLVELIASFFGKQKKKSRRVKK